MKTFQIRIYHTQDTPDKNSEKKTEEEQILPDEIETINNNKTNQNEPNLDLGNQESDPKQSWYMNRQRNDFNDFCSSVSPEKKPTTGNDFTFSNSAQSPTKRIKEASPSVKIIENSPKSVKIEDSIEISYPKNRK